MRAETPRDLQQILGDSTLSPLLARGLGRSYGDTALLADGRVLDCTGLSCYRQFDPSTGLLTCEAGVTLNMILQDFGPRGFLPLVSPGTKFVTVGGCIANDVHGKGHHTDGCFSQCVESFELLLADGSLCTVSRTEHPDLFWANFGGLGLLGVIVSATIRLRPVETTYFRETVIAVPHLDALLDAIDDHAHEPYSVAWVDSLAKGSQLGRGVLRVGDHARREDLPPNLASNPLKIGPPPRVSVPFELPSGTLNRQTIQVLNLILDQVQQRGGPLTHYDGFFYPLDFAKAWNRGYGRRGFAQYQFVVPLQDGRRHIRELLENIANSQQAPFLNVLKRFGPENPHTQLSFPLEGYTFAIDFPINAGLEAFLHRLDTRVAEMGGRIYLGKDAFLTRAHFERMYPKLPQWREVKAQVDPENRFQSAMGRRLGLCA